MKFYENKIKGKALSKYLFIFKTLKEQNSGKKLRAKIYNKSKGFFLRICRAYY